MEWHLTKMTIISTTVGKNPLGKWNSPHSQQESKRQYSDAISKTMISVSFQGKPFNITVIQVYAPTTNAKEVEVDQFHEDLEYLLELMPKKDVLFITGDWNAKVGSQEIPGVTGNFGLGEEN